MQSCERLIGIHVFHVGFALIIVIKEHIPTQRFYISLLEYHSFSLANDLE